MQEKAPAPGGSEAVNIENEPAPTSFHPIERGRSSRSPRWRRPRASAARPRHQAVPGRGVRQGQGAARRPGRRRRRRRLMPRGRSRRRRPPSLGRPRWRTAPQTTWRPCAGRFRHRRRTSRPSVRAPGAGGGQPPEARTRRGSGPLPATAPSGARPTAWPRRRRRRAEQEAVKREALDRAKAVPFPASPPAAAPPPAMEPEAAEPPPPVTASAPRRLQQPSPAPAGAAAGPAPKRPAATAPPPASASQALRGDSAPRGPGAGRRPSPGRACGVQDRGGRARRGAAVSRRRARGRQQARAPSYALARRAEQLFNEKRWAEAAAAYRELLRRSPGHPSA
jgi:hypothetical protein